MQVIQAFFKGGRLPSRILALARQNMGSRPPGAARHAMLLPPGLLPPPPLRSGEPLPCAVRRRLEYIFKADFSAVRVHVGPEAERLDAHAFALGSHLFIARHAYQPFSLQGQELIAHELTHVLQQAMGWVVNPFREGLVIVHDPELEAEAHRMAHRVTNGLPLMVPLRPPQRPTGIPPGLHAPVRLDAADTMGTGSGTIQLSKKHAAIVVNKHPKDFPQIKASKESVRIRAIRTLLTKEFVEKYINDKSKTQEVRKYLLYAWNNKQKTKDLIPIPEEFQVSGAIPITNGRKLERQDSELVEKFDYANNLQTVSKKIKLGTSIKKSKKDEKDETKEVPTFEDLTSLALHIRSFEHARQKGHTRPGAHFAFQSGEYTGLLESVQGTDLVFRSLKKSQNEEGLYVRDGKIFTWNDHAKELAAMYDTVEKQSQAKTAIIAALNNESVPKDKLLIETVGAMLCDAKTSITGFVMCVEAFQKSPVLDPMGLYSSTTKSKPVYLPAMEGGRVIPLEMKLSASKSKSTNTMDIEKTHESVADLGD